MARYIDADELLRKSFRIEGHFDLPSGKAQNFSAINETEILNFPTADVRPERHGKWIKKRSIYAQTGKFFECSCCGRQIETLSGELNYCPNCGAKMKGGKNE